MKRCLVGERETEEQACFTSRPELEIAYAIADLVRQGFGASKGINPGHPLFLHRKASTVSPMALPLRELDKTGVLVNPLGLGCMGYAYSEPYC